MNTHIGVNRAALTRESSEHLPHFRGSVEVFAHIDSTDAGDTRMLTVSFSPGAHTEWHSHDRGQYLESVEGYGWVCEWGALPRTLYAGERIWCPPDLVHMHGACGDSAWLQFSITPGGTEWIDGPIVEIPNHHAGIA